MALWSDASIGLRRLRSLITHLPPQSVTVLLLPAKGSDTATPRGGGPKRPTTREDIQAFADAFGVKVGIH